MKEIIKKPVVSEKSSEMNEAGKYTFIVDKDCNKIEIAKAVEKMYGVTVQDVNTIRYSGKVKSKYMKSRVVSGRRPAFKKAIITVNKGDMIDIYGN